VERKFSRIFEKKRLAGWKEAVIKIKNYEKILREIE
jgi:hypothetical protein